MIEDYEEDLKRQNPKSERKFRGTWARVELFDLVCDGVISPRDAWMLLVIDSLCSKERGCFATNAYLAKQMGMDDGNIKKIIRKLRRLGLVIDTSFDGRRRHISTPWSRYFADGADRTHQGEQNGPPRGVRTDPQRDIGEKSRGENPPNPPPGGSGCVVIRKSWPRKVVKILVDGITSTRKLNRSSRVNDWPRVIQLMETRDGLDHRKVLRVAKWYASKWREQDLNQGGHYIPVAMCAKEFREKFIRIERAMLREDGDPGIKTTRGVGAVDELVERFYS